MKSRKTIHYTRNDIDLFAIPVLNDNFTFVVGQEDNAIVIDPGEAPPVKKLLKANKLKLREILKTHDHHDHIGGTAELEEIIEAGTFYATILYLPTPGHVKEHTCFYIPEIETLFAGDILINGGCGRLMDGTAEQFYNSLKMIKVLDENTLILGGHDYLEENLCFALQLEPNNRAIEDRLKRYRKDPPRALFTTLAEELKTNPFLRAKSAEEFLSLRQEKDRF